MQSGTIINYRNAEQRVVYLVQALTYSLKNIATILCDMLRQIDKTDFMIIWDKTRLSWSICDTGKENSNFL